MRNLFLFLWKYNFIIFFLLIETLCGYIIVQNNNFQRTTFVNSTNAAAAKINSAVSSVTEYIDLRTTNDALSRENAALKTLLPDVFYIDSALKHIANDTLLKQQYAFMTAKVINNSVNRRNNYLTLNKGRLQGIRSEMGVICSDGVVGIIKDVSEHYSSVISFLHKDARFSARIKKSGYIGSMVWNGYDETHGTLNDIARHVKVAKGDTIVTSAFSSIFPEGIMIGIVDEVIAAGGDNFQEINVKLSTPFGKLSYVYVISNLLKNEQKTIEEPLKNDR
jgi:rod shape-determining protein MreC